MSRTGCLRSWFRCCGAVALTAFFALNSTSAWAANQTIAAGQTVSGAVGTEENTLIVNGTLTDSEISGGQNHKVNSGGTIDKSVISGGKLEISSGGVLENTTQTGGYINFNEGSSSENFIYEGGSFLAMNADIKNLTIKHLLSFYDDGMMGSDFDMSNVFSLTADEFVEVIKKQSNGDTLTEKEQTVLEDIEIYFASHMMSGLYGIFGNIDGLKTEVSEKTPLINYAKYLRNIMLIEFGLSDDAYLKNFYNKAKESYEALGDRLFMSFMGIRNAEITNIPLVLGGGLGGMTGQVGYGENITLHDGGYLMSAISAMMSPEMYNLSIQQGQDLSNITYMATTIKNLTIGEDAGWAFSTVDTITDSTQLGKDISIENGVAKGFTITDASSLQVFIGHKALDTIVEKGGELLTYANSTIENLVAKAGAILGIDKDTTFKGSIVIDKDADVSGSSYDFSQMFSNTNLDVDSLTVVGGINDAFVKDEVSKLVNEDTAKDKGLTLEGGEYSLANVIKEGSTQVAGWDVINIKATESAPATIVKLETDIELVGSNKEMNIGEGAVLDVSGHSPLEITIDGNVTNSGTMDFTIYDNDGEADDIVTIAGDYRAAPGALIVLNVEPEKNRADKMVVQGDVIGNTNVFLKSNSEKEPTAEILFAEVPNDDEATASGFDIWRVEGSPFAWDTKKEDGKWYTYIDGLLPPTSGGDGKPDMSQIRKLTGEMIAYMGLYDAGFEQTAGLSRNVLANVEKNMLLGKGCKGVVCRSINPVRSSWVAPVHQNLEIDAPYKYEAKISGLDAGIDIKSDGINKWGVLASYRKGNYEFDGSGDKYYSDKGSEIDIDSYAMGLYFRRDKYNSKFAGTIYAGMQKAEISSDDGAKAKTDALEIGASLDVSHIFEVAKDITITPELQISYQMLDYDNIKDNAGKKVQLEAAHRIIAEAGAKLEKKWTLDEGKAAIYVKPSVIQTIHGGGKLNVKALDSIHTTEDRTLGRFEIGAEYEVNTRWSVGASAAHTFGSDYKDTTFSLDAKYRF